MPRKSPTPETSLAVISEQGLTTLEREHRRAAIALIAEVRRDLEGVARLFYAMGERLRRILDEELYRVVGYETFAECVASEFSVALRQVSKMIGIARTYVKSDAERAGVERAYALIGYCEALGDGTEPGQIVREDRLVGELPFSASSVRDIVAATRALKATRRRDPRKVAAAREAKALGQEVRSALHAAGFARASVKVSGKTVRIEFPRASADAWIKRRSDS